MAYHDISKTKELNTQFNQEVPNVLYTRIIVFMTALLLSISISACDQYYSKDKEVDEKKPEISTETETPTEKATQPEKSATE